jgi:hypothetical protein
MEEGVGRMEGYWMEGWWLGGGMDLDKGALAG